VNCNVLPVHTVVCTPAIVPAVIEVRLDSVAAHVVQPDHTTPDAVAIDNHATHVTTCIHEQFYPQREVGRSSLIFGELYAYVYSFHFNFIYRTVTILGTLAMRHNQNLVH